MTEGPEPELEDLVADFIDRRLQGEMISVDAYCEEHAQHRAELEVRLATFDRLGEILDVDDPPLREGQVVGGYAIEARLGGGGMGTVYRARELALGRTVALKVGRRGTFDPRLIREARAVARLHHPSVVPILAFEEISDRPAIVMEFVDGTSLAERLRDRGHEQDSVRAILLAGAKIASALHAAHEAKVLHRDVKPSNVLISREGEPCLADFGLARLEDDESFTRSRAAEIGTPAYMSPEQIDGLPLGPTSDVFSLGVTLYEWLTGRRPFDADRRSQSYWRTLNEPAPSLRRLRRDLSADAENVILRCLEKNPADRYPDALVLAKDLEAAANGDAVTLAHGLGIRRLLRAAWRRRLLIGITAALAVVTALGARIVEERDLARVDEALARARLAFAEARFLDATSILESVLGDAPDEAELYTLRVESRLAQLSVTNEPMEPGLVQSVIDDLDRALRLGADEAAGSFARSFLLAYLGRVDEARAAYRRAVQLPVVTASDYACRARMNVFLERYPEALEDYRDAVRLQPAALVPYLQVAMLHAELTGNVGEGLAILDQCENVHPSHPGVLAERAWLWLCQERIDEGLALLKELVAREPPSSRAIDALARWYTIQEQFDQREALYDDLAARDPESPRLLFTRAALPLHRGELDEAERRIEAVLARFPGHPLARAIQVGLLVARGQTDIATTLMNDLAEEPGYPTILFAIARCSERFKDPADPAKQRFFERLGELRARGRFTIEGG